ncbi:Deuterolysin metalloprotease family-domain-containing protein [Aspergillus undulatus]|uniref:Deuterolysin metalloprotease family-domain-containing protein n=1 Tax=Aspergillus undulatus TaxID=1810928 RepID=UPI003CCCA694
MVHSTVDRATKMATAGAAAACAGPSVNFQKFFFSTKQYVLDQAASRLKAIAYKATTTGSMAYYYRPRAQDDCSGNIGAMKIGGENNVVNCQLYYDSPPASNSCSYLDQGSIALHERRRHGVLIHPSTGFKQCWESPVIACRATSDTRLGILTLISRIAGSVFIVIGKLLSYKAYSK